MGYLRAQEVDQLFLPSSPGNEFWVKMKKKVAYGDSRAAQSALMKFSQGQNGNAGSVVTDMEVGRYIGTLTVQLIVEWNLTDEQDRPLPISVESLDLLPDEDGEFLAQEAQKRKAAAARPEEQQGPFPTPSDKPSVASRSRTPK